MTIRKRALVTLGFFAAGFALAATALPLQLPQVCLFRRITGLPCATCGMTHAFCALAHGQVQAAADFNIASIPLAILLAIAALLLTAEALHNKPYLQPAWQKARRFILWTGPPILLLAWTLNLAKLFAH